MVNTNGVRFIQDTFGAAVFDLGIQILGCLNLLRWCVNNVALWRAVLFLQCAVSEDIQENLWTSMGTTLHWGLWAECSCSLFFKAPPRGCSYDTKRWLLEKTTKTGSFIGKVNQVTSVSFSLTALPSSSHIEPPLHPTPLERWRGSVDYSLSLLCSALHCLALTAKPFHLHSLRVPACLDTHTHTQSLPAWSCHAGSSSALRSDMSPYRSEVFTICLHLFSLSFSPIPLSSVLSFNSILSVGLSV